MLRGSKNKFIQMWLFIALIAGAATVVFMVNNYISTEILCDAHCSEKEAVSLALIGCALFGMFVGSLTYYLMSERHEKKYKKIKKNMQKKIKNIHSQMQEKMAKDIQKVVDESAKKAEIDPSPMLKFLPKEQRIILLSLVKTGGIMPQAEIVGKTNLTRVQVTRAVKQLEDKGAIRKEKYGMTNQILLSDELKNIFIRDKNASKNDENESQNAQKND